MKKVHGKLPFPAVLVVVPQLGCTLSFLFKNFADFNHYGSLKIDKNDLQAS